MSQTSTAPRLVDASKLTKLSDLSGSLGARVDRRSPRFIAIWSGLPTLCLLIILASVVKPSFGWLLGLLLLFSWMQLVGVVRAEFLRTRNFDYVKAARALGARDLTIIFRHVLPNTIAPVFVAASFGVAGAILVETSLSFLGFGVAPPTASWGEILRQGKEYVNEDVPHLIWYPGFAIFFTVTIFNLFGEGLRDALDPKLRGS